MILFEQAYEDVVGLVRKFEEHKDQFLSPRYQEAEVRAEFLDNFWTALGWDVRHREQTNPREQEVKIEKSDSVSFRKADYAFYLKPEYQRPVFLVEAKKPSEDLSKPEFYFQTARYGFNTATSVAVLTDFQEFHIIDCRRKPELVAGIIEATRLFKFSYLDYLDRDKFGEIYWKFSREAVAEGKLKEYWKSLKKPKGATKQLKLVGDQLQPPDDLFLEDLDKYRKDLASAFKSANKEITSQDLTEAAQKVLDRLVFIRFLQDKAIEPDFIIEKFTSGTKGSSWKSFIVQSQKLDKLYNGVVFKEHFIDKPSFEPPKDERFAAVADGFSHHNSPYLFSYIPVEILGSIYERFLGKVVVPKGSGIAVEEKPEVRKAGGVYYTPKYIVDYIVEHTVGKILEGKTPEEVSLLHFADIACGSGSFLIAIFDRTVHYLETWYTAHPENARKDGCRELDPDEQGRPQFALSLEQKRAVLQNNIFGVDIDAQAVEVAQFSLFLKLLESETIASVQGFSATQLELRGDGGVRTKKKTAVAKGQLTFHHGIDRKVLPDLSKNIKRGNSLVEYDISDLFPLTPEEEMKIKPFSFHSEFREIMSNGGFDAIVGNPPYVRIQTLNETVPQQVKYFNSKYLASAAGSYDIYVLFVERALSKVKPSGLIGYILPNKFTSSEYGKPLRKMLSEEKKIKEVINFGHQQVFQNATTYTCLLFLANESLNQVAVTTVSDLRAFQNGDIVTSLTAIAKFSERPWHLSAGAEGNLIDRLSEDYHQLGEFVDIFVGLQTSADDVFILDVVERQSDTYFLKSKLLNEVVELESHLLHSLVSGTDVKRYNTLKLRQVILFPYEVIDEKARLLDWKEIIANYPKIADYLTKNKTRLSKRESGKFNDHLWYRFGRTQNLGIQNRKKICVPRLVERLGGTLDSNGDFFLDNVDVGGVTLKESIAHLDSRYVIALINSRLLGWYFPFVSAPFRGGWYSANRQFLSLIPFREMDLKNSTDRQNYEKILSFVDQMLVTKKQLATTQRDSEKEQLQRKCDYLDGEIDKLVYELYGLTAEEIKIVEGQK